MMLTTTTRKNKQYGLLWTRGYQTFGYIQHRENRFTVVVYCITLMTICPKIHSVHTTNRLALDLRWNTTSGMVTKTRPNSKHLSDCSPAGQEFESGIGNFYTFQCLNTDFWLNSGLTELVEQNISDHNQLVTPIITPLCALLVITQSNRKLIHCARSRALGSTISSVVGRIVFGQLSQAQWQNGRADCRQNPAELAHQSLHFESYSYLWGFFEAS
jgi:hypothetical protein